MQIGTRTLFILTLCGSQGNEDEDFKEQQLIVRTKTGKYWKTAVLAMGFEST